MSFYLDGKEITSLQSQYGVTKENWKADLYYYKHNYITMFIASLLVATILPYVIAIISFAIGMLFSILFLRFKETLFFGIAILSYLLELIIGSLEFKIRKLQKQGKEIEEIHTELMDRMLNIYTVNPLVISFVDWMKLKLASRKNYKIIRSLESMQECYRTTFYIANILKNDKIKIIWLCYTDFISGEKCGHAVLSKGNWIYDSNRRRTYPKLKYLKTTKAEIFREYSLKDYLYDNVKQLKKEELTDQEAVFEKLETDYYDFKVFCNERNGVRDSNDT